MNAYPKMKNQSVVEGLEPLAVRYNKALQRVKFFEHPTKGDDFPIIVQIEDVTVNSEFYDLSDMTKDSEYMPELATDGNIYPQGY